MIAQDLSVPLLLIKNKPRFNQTSCQQYQYVKRVLDVAICLCALPVALVLMAVIAIAVRIDSPGSPIFKQRRIGKNGSAFVVYKFRSMWVTHDERTDRAFMKAYVAGQIRMDEARDGKVARFKPIRESQVTRLGKLLRKTSLDELPQIFNVLRGEMSLVGPRPNVPWEVDAYLPWHYERLNALPGITGLAQVMGRSDITFDQIARFDIDYVRHQNVRLDLWIFWRTLRAVMTRSGAG